LVSQIHTTIINLILSLIKSKSLSLLGQRHDITAAATVAIIEFNLDIVAESIGLTGGIEGIVNHEQHEEKDHS